MRDNVRDIHWAATARTGELQVRTHDFTANTRLMVVINGQLSHNQWGELMEYEHGPVEYAISAAATLCTQALRQGLPCGFAANLPADDLDECTMLPPSAGAAREEELLSVMARLRIKYVRRFPTFLEELSVLTGVDFIILSAYETPEIMEKIEMLRENANTVQLHLFSREEAAHAFEN